MGRATEGAGDTPVESETPRELAPALWLVSSRANRPGAEPPEEEEPSTTKATKKEKSTQKREKPSPKHARCRLAADNLEGVRKSLRPQEPAGREPT